MHHLIPAIIQIAEKHLIGIRLNTSLSANRTYELWSSFMPRRKEISSGSEDLYSMQVYPAGYFEHFNPALEFTKWACKETQEEHPVPEGMESFTLPGGLYAKFRYKGLNTDTSVFEYIYTQWLPASDYALDDRPHFEVLGSLYKNNDPESEEDIYIPVKPR